MLCQCKPTKARTGGGDVDSAERRLEPHNWRRRSTGHRERRKKNVGESAAERSGRPLRCSRVGLQRPAGVLAARQPLRGHPRPLHPQERPGEVPLEGGHCRGSQCSPIEGEDGKPELTKTNSWLLETDPCQQEGKSQKKSTGPPSGAPSLIATQSKWHSALKYFCSQSLPMLATDLRVLASHYSSVIPTADQPIKYCHPYVLSKSFQLIKTQANK